MHLGITELYTYYLCATNIAIQLAQSVRDHGVVLDQDFKFHEHTLNH